MPVWRKLSACVTIRRLVKRTAVGREDRHADKIVRARFNDIVRDISMKTVRVGLIGARFAANFHYNSLLRVTGVNVQVIGVTSATAASRNAFAEERGIKAFDTFEDMLDDVDVVDICTPGNLHEPFAVKAADAGKHVIVEKPFTGAYGPKDADENWSASGAPRAPMLEEALASAHRMVEAARKNHVKLMYAENWVYAPTVQKEVEVLTATKGQILWAIGNESHSGSTSPVYGIWRKSGGGSLVGKGCHPLSAVLYLKRVEGMARTGTPIRPRSVSARMHEMTKNLKFIDAGFLRTGYHDIEDFCQVHVVFDDGFCADIFASEIALGGVQNWLEIFANNHRMRCNMNPAENCILYNPKEDQLADVYITEKLGTKQGYSFPHPDEEHAHGYPQEMQDFLECVAFDREPKADGELGLDTVAAMYAAYVSAEQGGKEVDIPLPK